MGEHNSVTLKNMATGGYLSVLNNSTDNEATLGLTSNGTVDASKWRIMYNEVPGATYSNVRVMSKLTTYTKGLTTKQASTSNGAIVFQFEYNDNVTENDEWELVPAINLDVRYDDGYKKIKGMNSTNIFEVMPDESDSVRALNQIAGVELTSNGYPNEAQSLADICENYKGTVATLSSYCTYGGTDLLNDKCLNFSMGITIYGEPINGHHTRSGNVLTFFNKPYAYNSDNTLRRLYSGHIPCSPGSHGNKPHDGIAFLNGKASVVFSYGSTVTNDKFVSFHEFCHNFGAPDHSLSSFSNCAMNSSLVSRSSIVATLENTVVTESGLLCSDCLIALKMARHFKAMVG